MATRLILLRHGRSAWNEEKRCQGSIIEPRLARKGRRQAITAARQLKRANVSPLAIYASDQIRAVETALIIRSALGEIPFFLDPRLREMNQGNWEGRLYREIKAHDGEHYAKFIETPFEVSPPGGETMEQMVQRTFAVLDEIATRHPNTTVLVVSHEIPLAAVACAVQNRPLIEIWKHAPGNCHWFTVRWPLGLPIAMPDEAPHRDVLSGLFQRWAMSAR